MPGVEVGRTSAGGDLRLSRSGLVAYPEVFCLALSSLRAFRVEGLTTGKSRGVARFFPEDCCELLMVAGLDDFGS